MGNSVLTIYGDSVTDYVHVEDVTTNKLKSLSDKYIPVFNQDTSLLVTFADDTHGIGVVDNLSGYIYTVYREDLTTGSEMKYVGTIINGDLTITDYNISNHHQYQYIVFVETDDYICAPQETDVINTCWETWSLIGLKDTVDENKYTVDNDNVWKLNLSLESASQEQNIDRIEYKNLTKYPKISQGMPNYISSSISCFLGDISNEGKYIENFELLDKWRKFISSSNLKLLKDRKGHKYLVQTMGSNNQTIDKSKEQINIISFGWVEVGDVDKVIMTESGGEG